MTDSRKNRALRRGRAALAGLLAAAGLWGCAAAAPTLRVDGVEGFFGAGAVISASARGPVDFQVMLADLAAARVVYVGETHSDPEHHAVQLRLIRALHAIHPDLIVGLEMFDHTYQDILDQWSAGGLEEGDFLKKTHWYANWRYDFRLYRDILAFARTEGIRLAALNIPFHIPPKIAAGGLDSLGAEDRGHLPRAIDTSDPDHRAYVEKVFRRHRLRGGGDFEAFYQAQCVWEDAMAEKTAAASRRAPVVVLAGNGHIVRKFGIPDRAYARTGAPFRTVTPVPARGEAALDQADYLWLTP